MENLLRARFRLALLLLSVLLMGATSALVALENKTEQDLRRTLGLLLKHQSRDALEFSKNALQETPKSRLAHLLYADLLAVYAHQSPLFSAQYAMQKKRVADLRDELALRVAYVPPKKNHLPDTILRMSPQHPYILLLDAAKSRLYLLQNQNGHPALLTSYYTSVGSKGMGKVREGDNKTPLGVYQITSHLSGDSLPDLYGRGAWPINFPNGFDKLKGKNGSGIWIHGVPRNFESRPPKDSRGCIILNNLAVRDLEQFVEPRKTSLVLAERVQWLSPDAWETSGDRIYQHFQQWLADWQSLDVEKYLSHYSTTYQSENADYRIFTERTRRNARQKTFVSVTAKSVEVFLYPGVKNAYLLEFDQDYRSNNYQTDYRKRQLWREQGDGQWKIIHEGHAS